MDQHLVTATYEGEDDAQSDDLPRAYGQIPKKYKRLAKNTRARPTPVRAIRAQCLECCGWNSAEVKRCVSRECFLFPYRTGHRPKAGG